MPVGASKREKIGDRGLETRRFRSVPRSFPGSLLGPGNILVVVLPRDAQRVLTHQEAGLKASFLTLLLPEGRALSDPLPVTSASIERAGEAPFAESASRCASRGHIEREIVINRPVEEVFDFLADGRNEPQYNPHMLRAEQTSTGPVGPGTLFRTEVTTGRTIK